jgi:hypothetical protein
MLVVLMALSFALKTNGQGPGSYPTISGTVTDPQGAVIPGVKIEARNTDRQHVFKTISSRAGTFRIAPVALGQYTIQASSRDWILEKPIQVNIAIDSNLNLILHMELRKHK